MIKGGTQDSIQFSPDKQIYTRQPSDYLTRGSSPTRLPMTMMLRHHVLVRVLFLLLVVALIFYALLLVWVAKIPGSSRRFTHQSQEEMIWARLAGPLAADDPRVLQILQHKFLAPPSSLPYNLSNSAKQKGSRDFSWPWIHKHLLKLFRGQRSGFFVEAGALDGEYLSNTLFLERQLGWTGLLVEPDEESYKMLASKHRRAWTSNTCLSTESFPKRTILVSRRVINKGFAHEEFWWAFRGQTHELSANVPDRRSMEMTTHASYSRVQCFPLLSYLLVLNATTVDFLSLDVQGTESAILRSLLTSSRISVRVVVAEDENNSFDHAFMVSHGYVLVASDIDHVYVKMGDPALRGAGITSIVTNDSAAITTTTTTTADSSIILVED